tara:strand:- start:296 stop:868 length:573 start_codon:yes stop_codon:yes gene_type:complete
MKKILIFLTLTTFIFACKKDDDSPILDTANNINGCIDELALNYNSLANIDDGSCEYNPSELKISSITINTMPMTNNGANWDLGAFGLEHPDVFYVLKQGVGDIISSSSQDNVAPAAFPILFTENLPYTIDNISKEYTIELYDSDQIAGIGEDEIIGSCSFIPDEFISNGGNQIDIKENGIDMTLNVQWLQ